MPGSAGSTPSEPWKCQNPDRVDTGGPCDSVAVWFVGVGSRISDRQLSCAYCLSYTCAAMVNAEGRDTVALTVIRIT